MRVHDLGVKQEKLAIAQSLHQFNHGDFRSFGDAKEHGFADEGPADNNTQDAAGEAIALPGFKAIGPSSLMEGLVDLLELGGDPGRFSVSTTGDYCIEVPVNGNAEAFFVKYAPQRLGIAKPFV